MKIKLINENITSDYTNSLLRARGIKDIEKFLNPDETCLQTWKDLDNIFKGIELIKNLSEDSKIAIVTDSDVDGYTSATIMGQYLRLLYPDLKIDYYLHSGKQHGLEDKWEEIAKSEYELVILPDAGSNDGSYAKKISCNILVIDHHIIEDDNTPDNMVIINNQNSPKYKNKNLSGAGMVYQFCRGLDECFNKNWSNGFLDLAALGVCADMMSGLETENQYLWKKGFSQIRNFFFLSLIRKQAYSITGKAGATSDEEIIKALNPTSVAFYIVPLINAMIRVGTQEEKERMLLAFLDGETKIPSKKRGAKGTLEMAAIESARECANARNHQNKFKENAVALLEQKIFKHDLLENQILFIRLDEEDFPSELNGLIAMVLSSKYKKPTIVARINDEGYIKGSARGLNNSELLSFKDYLGSTNLFEYTQGHDNAFGLSIHNKDLDKLHKKANEELLQYHFDNSYYEVEFERNAHSTDLTQLITDISLHKDIWSQKCNEPLIHISGLHISKNDIQVLGKNSDTLKISKNEISYMKFFAKDMIKELEGQDEIILDIVGKCNLNEWCGRITPQIFIENYEIKEDNLLDF